ncbi:DNA methyltransferase [Lactobacillus iners]|uniref:DNA methyltransferase n=1 Tax=Lactobacillus iners TaxID=147802 RepID=UPI0001E5DF8C|nr:site-specific DNA-methyltransferase [Lactobacillus iners]EFO69125.1 DNA (cytosine-5-)-methyltransferase [Lactobacillus iners LactinV 03V1-b]PNH17696.1 site-specific DNA-methyltransferase [Lactobacillus iners]
MKNIFDTVADLLLTNDKYKAEDGKLLKAVVYSDVMAMNETLLTLLLSNKDVKETFFKDVQGTLVFDKQKFAWFMESKEFLPDSYTSYTNKIGLTHNGNFISQTNDVVLDFPYKDCVLEGGQDKDDQKRSEIFYNETIASDEISRMLAPKVFTNAKRYTAVGEKDLTGELDPDTIQVKEETGITFNDDDNLIIKGNNLIALASLLKRYEGKVKCIYIDPPYNTKNDSFNYNDSFNHSTWLTFMKNRLELARKLLREDGTIFVQCDDNEQAYLKVLMDSIFGRNNFQAEIVWVLEGASGYKSLVNNYVRGHESILFYSKSNYFNFNKIYLPYSEKQIKRFSKLDDSGRRYKPITKTRRLYLDEAKGVPLTDVWTDIASFQTIVNSPERTGFDTQKPEKLIERIIETLTTTHDLVLDFHLGSGTTAAVAHKMGRRYIGVEQMDYIQDITVERLKKVLEGEQGGISKAQNWHGGGSFVYCELKEDANTLITTIQNATEDTIESVKASIYADERIVPYLTKQELADADKDFENLTLEEKKQALIKLVDKNKLYVNASDMDDESYHVSDDDKKFTNSFYKGV